MAANDVPCCKPMFWVYLLICVVLVVFAGLMSGLTLGLLSLSPVDLEVLVQAGQPQDRKNAAKILPVLKNRHLLLCTLLIGNSLAMEALPIFLDALLPAWGAILISVTLILAFGEIIPQAVCSRYGLSLGAKMAMVVRLLLLVFFPITYPISKVLDLVLGKGHFELFGRAELKSLVGMHGNEAGKGGELTHDETTIITGALDLTQKTARDAMTPISETFSLDINSKLDLHTMGLIMTQGHSRVPIYSGSPSNIIGLILVKNLIVFRPEDETPIQNLTIRNIPRVNDCSPLYQILNEFQEGNSHMAVVVKCAKDVKTTPINNVKSKTPMSKMKMHRKESKSRKKGTKSQLIQSGVVEPPGAVVGNLKEEHNMLEMVKKLVQGGGNNVIDTGSDYQASYSADEEVIGIITMEDVIEELLQEEIYDETDEYIDVHNRIRINMLQERMSSPGVPRRSHVQQHSATASPRASYHGTPLQSPIRLYVQSPVLGAASNGSPKNPSPTLHGEISSARQSSPAPRHVSRKPYEKLNKLEVV
ncbi:hypothetical protein Syun_013251 [Stephania yunnanensis]|uniref:CNNM transmembrane domain-containing protein n=1 Tax=Stephania yunnanensis TaxID=152371 RepID=A0AAP0K111_9MAGN